MGSIIKFLFTLGTFTRSCSHCANNWCHISVLWIFHPIIRLKNWKNKENVAIFLNLLFIKLTKKKFLWNQKFFKREMSQPIFFFWGKFWHNGEKKKNLMWIVQRLFWKKRKRKCKSCHNLMKKGHMLPYLDKELLLVTKTRQDSKEIILDCLSFFGACFWKTS